MKIENTEDKITGLRRIVIEYTRSEMKVNNNTFECMNLIMMALIQWDTEETGKKLYENAKK